MGVWKVRLTESGLSRPVAESNANLGAEPPLIRTRFGPYCKRRIVLSCMCIGRERVQILFNSLPLSAWKILPLG